jgi:WD40 repeat protein
MGRTGSALAFIEGSTLAHVCGNAVRLFSTDSRKETCVWGSAWGIGCIAVGSDAKAGLLAFAETKDAPSIHVHEFTSLERPPQLVQKLTGVAELEVISLAFSADGTRLISMGGLPDFSLIVWDWRSRTIVVRAAMPEAMTSLSVCTSHADVFLTSGAGATTLWKLRQIWDVTELVPHTRTAANAEEAVIAHAWGSSKVEGIVDMWSRLYAVTADGKLRCMWMHEPTGADARADDEIDAAQGSAIICVATVGDLVMAGTEEGALLFVSQSTHKLVHLHAFDDQIVSVVVAPLSAASDGARAPRREHSTVCVSLLDGSLMLLRLPPELVHATTEFTSEVESSILHAYHQGPISAIACLSDSEHSVSSGTDGTLRVWHTRRRTAVAALSFAPFLTFTAIATHRTAPLVVGGSSQGVLVVAEWDSTAQALKLRKLQVSTAARSPPCTQHASTQAESSGTRVCTAFQRRLDSGVRCE